MPKLDKRLSSQLAKKNQVSKQDLIQPQNDKLYVQKTLTEEQKEFRQYFNKLQQHDPEFLLADKPRLLFLLEKCDLYLEEYPDGTAVIREKIPLTN